MRKTLALTLLALMLVAANAFAVGEARIQGKVIDAATKKPIPGATIHFESTGGRTVKQDYKADKSGDYRFIILDATLNYKFTWSAEGYEPATQQLKLKPGETLAKEVELVPVGAAGSKTASATTATQQGKPDPAILAYNEGAQLANEGKTAEAIAKFEAAAAQKENFTAAYQAMAKLYLRNKDNAKAIDAANKALAADADDQDMLNVLADAYEAMGQKAKAAEYRKKLPANANALFNEAARLINENKDSQAEPLLKQAIAADDKMAVAYYELGMLYVRAQKNADARTNLQKYLDLDPNGKEAATAKEMLKYVK